MINFIMLFIMNLLINVLSCRASILTTQSFNAKLADFWFAREMPTRTKGRTVVTGSIIAKSDGYFPPELHSGCYSAKSDVFSYGVVSLHQKLHAHF